jgi:hypothetical protein
MGKRGIGTMTTMVIREGEIVSCRPESGDEAFHMLHTPQSPRKDPFYYGQYGWREPPTLPYFWNEDKWQEPKREKL